ncbi:MAG: radical SAM family heme chaperone HemW [Tildeniella nuda ZEHNDER 1965/U140]|jgi:oxygen-independent coproporphyrinogen-3 oxidase|nr:radical SAM family heme chaperone HemW [Tildeniella nuda ZEHNDER 1965/U140]
MLLLKTDSREINLIELTGSAYVHIPFCRRRCFYCDFAVSVVGDRPPIARADGLPAEPLNGSNSGTIAHYVDVLCQEIRCTTTAGRTLDTVFFGGGTPSLLSVEQLSRILSTLEQQFGIAAGAEISMEIDPGTFDRLQLQGYRAAGVNRVSIGVQAFQTELLQACGRSHTVDDVYTAVALVQQAEFEHFSLDLISGLPHQTPAHWQESLDAAIALAPTHLSCYDLTIEPVTAFGRQYKPGMQPLPSDEATAAMYRTAQQRLTAAGYHHYEISNYAKPGYQCRHNRVYWENRSFYGFGMGATSYLEGKRLSRPRKTREYYEWVEERIVEERLKAKGLRLKDGQAKSLNVSFDASDLLLDTLMLGLRLAEGLSLAALTKQFGRETLERVWQCLQPFHARGWVVIATDQNGAGERSPETPPNAGRLQLTDPEGFLFSNVILVSLFETFD